ncbi:MAG: heme-degrading domain-containing protein [Rhodobacteraceae bacterium]|jgi:uncharacterized protein (UPF0303 family)|nr:heme-degrading domain-containing protein [Paracoccaceae bacterium]
MDSATLKAEAEALHLPAFSETTAWQLGNILHRLADAATLPIVINIRTANRTLFHAALPGSAALNDNWARRKSNTALMFGEASFLVGARNREKPETLERHGLPATDYADAGGAVPLFVAGALVAVVTVSGLPQAEDHALVMKAIRLLQPDS